MSNGNEGIYFGTIINLMHCFKIWSPDDSKRTISFSVYILVPAYVFFFALSCIEIYHNWGDMLSTTDAVNTFVIYLATSHKYFRLIYHEKDLKKLMKMVENNFSVPVWQNDALRNSIVKSYVQEVKKLTILWTTLCFTTLCGFMILPLVDGLFHYYTTNVTTEIEWKLPYRTWTPFNDYGAIVTVPLYVYHMFMGFVLIAEIPAFDTIYFSLINHSCAQLKIIQNSLINIVSISAQNVLSNEKNGVTFDTMLDEHYTAEENKDQSSLENKMNNGLNSYTPSGSYDSMLNLLHDSELDKKIRKNVGELVNHHEKILEFIDGVEAIVNAVFLTQFLCSATLFCLTGFQLTVILKEQQLARFLNMMELLGAAIFEMGMFCYYANRVMDEGINVGKAAYDSQWYYASKDYGNSVSIIMARCTRPPKITFGKFADLTMENFASVLQISYSYFTLLTRINE
uniref:Odorant receptor n=1 Tax=Locusta migratoria TaxID=7004 RepID=A0A0M4JB60_LOCMI|nr:odorant receptor 1 [Locusta migratoria]